MLLRCFEGSLLIFSSVIVAFDFNRSQSDIALVSSILLPVDLMKMKMKKKVIVDECHFCFFCADNSD